EFCESPHGYFPTPTPRFREERDFQIEECEDPLSAGIWCAPNHSLRAKWRSALHHQVRQSANIPDNRNRQYTDQCCIDAGISCRGVGGSEEISTTRPPRQSLDCGALYVSLSFAGCCKCCGGGPNTALCTCRQEPV